MLVILDVCFLFLGCPHNGDKHMGPALDISPQCKVGYDPKISASYFGAPTRIIIIAFTEMGWLQRKNPQRIMK